ncbi:hypothetical protein L21SP2_0036 [Salinispira pacifica]|uniref:Uncharacterized protein n=1 Tax=Salinispira pacifica TaxID=1307761 RepID=V5WCH3_9SPIO|nr:hypothetical protein L21SP2_0036 [Salinispira pacifica]
MAMHYPQQGLLKGIRPCFFPWPDSSNPEFFPRPLLLPIPHDIL